MSLIERARSFRWRKGSAPSPLATLDQTLGILCEPFLGTLRSMYRGDLQHGSDGGLHILDANTRISPEQGMWIYQLCRDLKPQSTVEVGMAYGFSTMYFLAAIQANGLGSHLAVDPFQEEHWHGIGLEHARLLSLPGSFRFVHETSVRALTHCASQNLRFDVIFIDGNHRFDDVLVDFTLAAQVCRTAGHIILDDMWMPSIRRAVAFIRANRLDFTAVATPIGNIAVFQKNGDDRRGWNHYLDF